MSMTLTFLLTLVFFAGAAGLIWLGIALLRHRRMTAKGAIAAAVCVLALAAAIWYFAPRPLKGYDAAITQQSVSWHCTDDTAAQPACAQPDQLPGGLQLRRYRLGDSPMPGGSVNTRAAQFELTLADGKTAVLMLCPDRPARSRIWLYDEPYGVSTWFLTRQSAERCLAAFLPDAG